MRFYRDLTLRYWILEMTSSWISFRFGGGTKAAGFVMNLLRVLLSGEPLDTFSGRMKRISG